MNVLLIEDEQRISLLVERSLKENGFVVTTAFDGKTGLSMALQEDFSLILLDIMLPGMNGLEVCNAIRKTGNNTPILMLTALGTVDDKVEGLNKGADDYLVKPFHMKELIARVVALTRRNYSVNAESKLNFSEVILDRETKMAYRADKEISLTAKEYKLLELFMENTGKVLSRSVIAERVWGYDFDPNTNIIDVYVNYLRNKIDKGFHTKLLHTMVGMGYVMKEN